MIQRNAGVAQQLSVSAGDFSSGCLGDDLPLCRKRATSRRIPECKLLVPNHLRTCARCPTPLGGDAVTSIAESQSGNVTIGFDPHPGTHTACAMSSYGRVLEEITVVNDQDGWDVVIGWASKFPNRRWAIEGPGNRYVAEFVRQLLSAGETVYPISPSMTAQYRGRRTRGKDDEIDAGSAARVLLANEDLPLYSPMSYEAELKELTRVYQKMQKQVKSLKMSSKTMQSKQAKDAMAGAIEAFEVALTKLKRELNAEVTRIAPSLLEYRGVGPVVAATLLAEAGRMERFPSQHHFASYCGAAPIRWQSGGSETVRVNPSGNRRLNWAAHIVALSRLGHDQRTKDYRDRKLAEGHTKRQVLRLLKTYICRELYTALNVAQSTNSETPDPIAIARSRACEGCGKVA